MRSFRIILLLLFALLRSWAQVSVVEFSTFTMGFEVLPSANHSVASVIGQQASETVEGASLRVEAGLLNSQLWRNALTVAVKPDTARLGYSLRFNVLLPRGSVTFAESLYYRKGGERSFSRVPLQRTGDSLSASIPAEAVSLRGLEYFIQLSSPQGTSRFPLSGVDTVRVRFDWFASPIALQRRTYRMVSVPAELNDVSLLGVLGDDFGPYNPTVWRLFRWERDRYAEHPAIGAGFTPGNAFWLITQAGGSFDVERGKSMPSLQPATITLDTGWNQIASPFAFRIDWGAVIANVNVSPAYFYDGVSPYQINVTVLEPWEGYFVENRSGQPLILPIAPVEASASPSNSQPLAGTGGRQYVVQLSAEVPASGLKDLNNFLGFKEGATSGDDRLDLHEPPPIGEYIQLSIAEGRLFAANFKPFPAEGEEWNLQLTSTLPNRTIAVHLEEYGIRPENFRVFVLDKDEFTALSIQDGSFIVRTGEAQSVRSLKVLIGTEEFAATHSGGIPLVPLAYALDQNFPNPFNPSTSIRYQLSKKGRVVLQVFNVLGQLVKTLVHGEQVTGTYTVQWNGENDGGFPAASGMYVYRLRAGEFTASRKMILVR